MAQHGQVTNNGPPVDARPDSPEMPGTPTSATTSLSALSTTAINDGHRGHAYAVPRLPAPKGHTHHSLEAERADRISRLAGLSTVNSSRSPQVASSSVAAAQTAQPSAFTVPTPSPSTPVTFATQATPISLDLSGTSSVQQHQQQPQVLGVPAYFDSNGQPVAVTRMSTVGTASATASLTGQTTANMSTSGVEGTADASNQGDRDGDIDMMSTDSGYTGGVGGSTRLAPTEVGVDAMDEHLTAQSSHAAERYDDRMSDDGTASLVGFGEGANSTISGPIYVRRPLPGSGMLERSSSNLSDVAVTGGSAPLGRRDRQTERFTSALPVYEDREETPAAAGTRTPPLEETDTFVDSAGGSGALGTGPIQPGQTSALRETQLHKR